MAEIVIYTGYLLLCCRLFILLVFVKNIRWALKSKAHRFLFFYALVAFSIAILELGFIYIANHYTAQILPYLQLYEIDDTFFLSPFYYLNELFFYGFSYSYVFDRQHKKSIQIITLALVVLEIVNTVWGEGYKDAQEFGSLILNVFIIVLSVSYIRYTYLKRLKIAAIRESFFVISWGLLIPPILVILVYFLSKNLFDTDTSLYYALSIIRMLVESFCLLLVAYGVNLVRGSRHLYS